MARAGAGRPPFHAVVALCHWAVESWGELEYGWIQSGRNGELIDLRARKLIAYIYGDLMARMPDHENREKLRKQLNRTETEVLSNAPDNYDNVPGVPEGWRPGVDVPVPDWWTDEPWEAEPGFEVGSSDEFGAAEGG